MKKNFIIILAILCLLYFASSSQIVQYQIYKSYVNDPHDTRKVNLGILQIRKNLEYNQIQTNIKPNFPQLVSKNDIQDTTVILSFVPKNTNNIQEDNKIFKTAVVEKLSGSHDQIIAIIVGVDMKIKAINYMEKRSPLQEVKSEVIKMQQGKEQFTKMEMAPKNQGQSGAPQDQSFFSKYKWPIIIGVVLLYVTSTGDKQGNPQGGQGGAPAR